MHKIIVFVIFLVFILTGAFPALSQSVPEFPPNSLYLPVVENVEQSTIIATSTRTPSPTSTATPTITSTPSPAPTETPQETINILSDVGFVPFEGSDSYYIIGEVVNNTNTNVEFVRINVTLRDGSGNVIGSEFGYSMLDILSPGMKSPFQVLSFDVPQSFASYDLVTTWSTTELSPDTLEIINHTSRFDNSGTFHVTGEVRNQTDISSEFVKVIVTAYDPNGEVSGVDYSFTNPDEIASGGTASFDVNVYFWSGKPDQTRISSYSVVAEGN